MTEKKVRTRSEIWIPLLQALILPLFFFYYGRQSSYELLFSKGPAELTPAPAFYEWIFGIILFTAVPVLVWTAVLGLPLKKLGFTPGNFRKGLLFFLIVLPFMIFYAYSASRFTEFQLYYPRFRYIGMADPVLTLKYYSLALLFFLSRDLFLRGFLVQGLKDSLGTAGAVMISSMAAAPSFVGASILEGTAGLFISILFAWIAAKTGSFLYTALLSFVWFISLEFVLVYGF